MNFLGCSQWTLISTYFEAIQNVASSLSNWSKYIEDCAVCYFSRLTFGNRSILFGRSKRKFVFSLLKGQAKFANGFIIIFSQGDSCKPFQMTFSDRQQNMWQNNKTTERKKPWTNPSFIMNLDWKTKAGRKLKSALGKLDVLSALSVWIKAWHGGWRNLSKQKRKEELITT